MMDSSYPMPAVMGVDRVAWSRNVTLANVINAQREYEDALGLDGVKKVLIIGVTNGIEADFLRLRGFEVTTFDIDSTFRPDEVGSCDDLSRFGDGSFDLIVASHVLEHLPWPAFDVALREFSRVARYALVYLPVAGRYLAVRVSMGSRRSWTFRVDVFNYWHRPTGMERTYRFNEHYWEIGYRGYRKRDIRAAIATHFYVCREYRNLDWLPSYNFVLESRSRGGQSGVA